MQPPCGVCAENADTTLMHGGVIWEDEIWILKSNGPPFGVAGWLTLQTKSHTSSAADFNDAQSSSFGPTLKRVQAALLSASGAARVYVAALGEMHKHFHMHLVPRYEATEATAAVKGWSLFMQLGEVTKGTVIVDVERHNAIIVAVRALLN
jgi:diadenosine tetraphosphate (Ap4A) HIT family hydrolase